MNQNTKKILKGIAVLIVVPTVLVAGYYGVKKGMDYFAQKKLDLDLKKINDGLIASIQKRSDSNKTPVEDKEKTDLINTWNEELKKLSPKALTAFSDYFSITIPYGKTENGQWAYELKGEKESIELVDKLDGSLGKYDDEINVKTKVGSLFIEFAKSLYDEKSGTYYVWDKIETTL